MNTFSYYVVKCNECNRPLQVRREGMQVPNRFIMGCVCGHFYEYFAQQVEVMEMDFKPWRELPRQSSEGDLERMLEERKQPV